MSATVRLEIPGTPPSYNVTAHAHWHKVRRVKQEWQQFCWAALMEQKVPKGLGAVTATAILRFPQRRRRDEGNFRVIIEKALGDSLVLGGYIPDDTPEHYRFGSVELIAPAPKAETILILGYDV